MGRKHLGPGALFPANAEKVHRPRVHLLPGAFGAVVHANAFGIFSFMTTADNIVGNATGIRAAVAAVIKPVPQTSGTNVAPRVAKSVLPPNLAPRPRPATAAPVGRRR